MAADQRYCLSCGNRRGDPRLPFMDAVVFMEAINRPPGASSPPPPPREQRRVSPNASLIAGVATLVLAIGVGVLIGRSGTESQPTASAPPQVITVSGGGGGGEASSSAPAKQNANSGKAGKKADSDIETGSSGTSKAAEEVLKPEGDVQLAPPTTQVGDECEKGTAGCGKSGKFEGNFFGE